MWQRGQGRGLCGREVRAGDYVAERSGFTGQVGQGQAGYVAEGSWSGFMGQGQGIGSKYGSCRDAPGEGGQQGCVWGGGRL